ncbi:hypothetical protein NQ317_012746 [Molorchus minor]|uniref:Uncharacterized protein n=1 Tax=Molorchus minor TaxID=1323400 RepID=A0ABQ9K1C8_9CUCU|nr:hypothetical protein NQ317_012746 [Molorchus minor]
MLEGPSTSTFLRQPIEMCDVEMSNLEKPAQNSQERDPLDFKVCQIYGFGKYTWAEYDGGAGQDMFHN